MRSNNRFGLNNIYKEITPSRLSYTGLGLFLCILILLFQLFLYGIAGFCLFCCISLNNSGVILFNNS